MFANLQCNSFSDHPASALVFGCSTCILLAMNYENRLPPVSPPVTALQAVPRIYFGYLPEGQISTFLDSDGNAVATWEVAETRDSLFQEYVS